jgi:hypothetical protein
MPRSLYRRPVIIREFILAEIEAAGPVSAASLTGKFNRQWRRRIDVTEGEMLATLSYLAREGLIRRLAQGIYGPHTAVTQVEMVASRASAPLRLLSDLIAARPKFGLGDSMLAADVAPLMGQKSATTAHSLRKLRAGGYLIAPKHGWVRVSTEIAVAMRAAVSQVGKPLLAQKE